MSEHTKGQWTVSYAGFDRRPCVVARRAGSPAAVAMCESEEDAHLIAAAPDLLEALQMLMHHEMAHVGPNSHEAVTAARAALAKAQGRA